MRLGRPTLVPGVLALVMLLPTTAQADTYVHADATRDVVSVTMSTGSTTPAPDQVQGDILRTRLRHKTHRIVLKMRVGELTRSGRGAIHTYAIRTKNLERVVVVETSSGHWDGRATMFKPNGKRTLCHVRRKIDYTKNWARISVPRSCLGSPRWVRAGMAEITISSANVTYADDAQANGQIYNRPVYGPRVRR